MMEIKEMKKILLSFAILLALPRLFSCSIFMYSENGHAWFCGNEDWSATDPALLGVKGDASSHGYALLGWMSWLPAYAQAGVNSEGLGFDWAMVPPQRYRADPSRKDAPFDMVLEIMRTCATVDDVVAFVTAYNFPHVTEEHILFADRNGSSCVLEFDGTDVRVIRNSEPYQAITNFNLLRPELGGYPCARYARLSQSLGSPCLGETDLATLLDAVHQEGRYPTIYSYVADLKAMEIVAYYRHDFSRPRRFRIATLIASEARVDLTRE